MRKQDADKKAAVFISAGLGDALLLVPLVRHLKENRYAVTGIVTSPFPCEELFKDSDLFEELIPAKNKIKLFRYVLRQRKSFDLCILNYFASNRSNLLAGKNLAEEVHTNHLPEKASPKQKKGILYFRPQEGLHDAEQNMILAGLGPRKLTESLMKLERTMSPTMHLPESYIALQISAGNNRFTYKNWAVENWITFLGLCKTHHPELRFVLLGDQDEVGLAAQVIRANTGNVIHMAGQTNVFQAMEVIQRSMLFMGLDGGLMHAAAFLGKPTCSLWGPSSPD
ncbi:MAG TPA: glycosyltransferase family 9 protein, partial [Bacteroidia bacterium]|nr:glycosyltransferase family 9 protein [Bacteroidia bacterium]